MAFEAERNVHSSCDNLEPDTAALQLNTLFSFANKATPQIAATTRVCLSFVGGLSLNI